MPLASCPLPHASCLLPLAFCIHDHLPDQIPATPPLWAPAPGGRDPADPPTPPSGPLTVNSVTGLEDGIYRFAFSGVITLSGGDVSAIEVGIAGDDLWLPAGDPVLVGDSAIDVNIGSNGFSDWRILTQPVAITQPLAVPMGGGVG